MSVNGNMVCPMARLVPVLIAACLCAMPARALEPVNFDGFLTGLESCKPGARFDAYFRSLAEKYGNDAGTTRAIVRGAVRLAVPADVAAGLGGPASVNRKSYTDVTVPAAGTYKGLGVTGLIFSFGNQNGISVAAVTFSAPLAEVRKVFGAAAARANAAGKKEEYAQYAVSFGKGPGGRIICDRST